MSPDNRKKFREFCCKFATISEDALIHKYEEFKWILVMDINGNPFPEINDELQQLTNTTNYAYRNIIDAVGNFCMYGLNNLYPIMLYSKEAIKLDTNKKELQNKVTETKNAIEMIDKFNKWLSDGLTREQLIEEIESEINSSGFGAIVASCKAAEYLDILQKVIEDICQAKEYLTDIDTNNLIPLASDIIMSKVLLYHFVEKYGKTPDYHLYEWSLKQIICIYKNGLNKWIDQMLNELSE